MKEFKSLDLVNPTANGQAKKSVVMANGSPFFGTSKYDLTLREHIIKALNAMEKGISYEEKNSEGGSAFKIQKNAPPKTPWRIPTQGRSLFSVPSSKAGRTWQP